MYFISILENLEQRDISLIHGKKWIDINGTHTMKFNPDGTIVFDEKDTGHWTYDPETHILTTCKDKEVRRHLSYVDETMLALRSLNSNVSNYAINADLPEEFRPLTLTEYVDHVLMKRKLLGLGPLPYEEAFSLALCLYEDNSYIMEKEQTHGVIEPIYQLVLFFIVVIYIYFGELPGWFPTTWKGNVLKCTGLFVAFISIAVTPMLFVDHYYKNKCTDPIIKHIKPYCDPKYLDQLKDDIFETRQKKTKKE